MCSDVTVYRVYVVKLNAYCKNSSGIQVICGICLPYCGPIELPLRPCSYIETASSAVVA
jgi:hypothetical protein